MTKTRREERREATLQEIKTLAWEQMAQNGPANLSLRAIARQMRMSSAALYRYFENRDALITALSLDAHHEQVEALEVALDALPPEDYAGRLMAFAQAYRDWAIAYPIRFALIYGTPIPDYQTAWEVIIPVARRGLEISLHLMQAAWQDGVVELPVESPDFPPELHQQLARVIEEREYEISPPVLYLGIVSWSRLYGLVSLEVFGHLGPLVEDPADLFRLEMQNLLSQLGFGMDERRKK